MIKTIDIVALVTILAVLIAVVLTPWIFWFVPTETDYTYHVKVQQAYDVSRVEDSDVTPFESLSQDEQDVLYRAFKEIETGQFVGEDGAEVRVTFDERRQVFDTWRSIEVNGIVLLVAVAESTTSRTDFDQPWVWELSMLWFGAWGWICLLILGAMFVPPY